MIVSLIERSSISLKSRCHSGVYDCRCTGSPSRTRRLKTKCAGNCNPRWGRCGRVVAPWPWGFCRMTRQCVSPLTVLSLLWWMPPPFLWILEPQPTSQSRKNPGIRPMEKCCFWTRALQVLHRLKWRNYGTRQSGLSGLVGCCVDLAYFKIRPVTEVAYDDKEVMVVVYTDTRMDEFISHTLFPLGCCVPASIPGQLTEMRALCLILLAPWFLYNSVWMTCWT